MSTHIGVIAEDTSDVDVVEEIIAKITRRNRFKIKKFVGHSCGKVRAKCRDWACNLRIQRCTILIIAHDLDENSPQTIYAQLQQALHPSPIAKHIIVIPVHEIEAWLLADHDAINRTFGTNLRKVPNPEAIRRPKEHLRDLVRIRSGKTRIYINTIHNKKIAANASLNAMSRCGSFTPLREFLYATL